MPATCQDLLRQLAAVSVLVSLAASALAQTRPPATATTKIPAIGTFAPGTDMQLVQRTLAAEARSLPLGKALLMAFELRPIGPLSPLRQLLKSPEAH
jgi:hypothetical protein